MKQSFERVTAIWLVREGNYAVVKVEREGEWHEVCREYYDSPFSHIVEGPDVKCPDCRGKGTTADYVGLEMKPVEVECDRCNGTGITRATA
jgi:DnaJ-class molecular chaperone